MSLFAHSDTPLQPTLRAVQALIVHESRLFEDARPDFAFTTHAIEHGDSGVRLGAGRLLAREDQQALLNILLGALSAESAFLPSEILSHSPAQLAWYVPGRVRPMWFRESGHTRRLQVPWPTLIFRVREGRLSLAALCRSRRPSAEDPLFHAPIMNVYANTELCAGNAKLPRGWSLAHRPAYEKAVFDTAFTHVNHDRTLRAAKDGSITTAEHLRFWRELSRGSRRAFPSAALVPLNQSLGMWLSRG
jgi:PRTRC genetic system protein B